MSNTENLIIPFLIKCPYCSEYIYIEELNCRIFRHGVLKKTNEQINPHSSKEECEKLYINNKIYGCGKPFKIEIINNMYFSIICDYE